MKNHLNAEPIHAEEASAAFGAPRNEFGNGGGHLGSAAAWLGGVFVCCTGFT